MKPQLFLLVFSICCACAACNEGFPFYDRTEEGSRIDKAAAKMLKTTYSLANDKNVVLSPVAILMLLNLYISTAGPGKARDEILELCGEANLHSSLSTYQRLSRHFSNYGTSAMKFKNKVYLSNNYSLANNFSETARGLKTDTEKINFNDLKISAQKINEWAAYETKGYIKDVVSEDKLRSDMTIALFNVIFFEGHWNVPFEFVETVEGDFHVDNNTIVKKPIMKLKMPLLYGENKEFGARFIELPYKEDDFRMVIILPDEIDGLANVLDKLSTKGILDEVYKLTTYDSVILELPTFKIDAEINLKQILPQLGVKTIFTEKLANIVEERSIVADTMFQKAFIKVNEEGATAGAFTGTLTRPMAALITPPVKFIVDHPFAFNIMYKNIILFAGTYVH